jgi:hypothetical protein
MKEVNSIRHVNIFPWEVTRNPSATAKKQSMPLRLPVKTEYLNKDVIFQQNLQYNLLKNLKSNVIRRSSLNIIILTLNWLIVIYEFLESIMVGNRMLNK